MHMTISVFGYPWLVLCSPGRAASVRSAIVAAAPESPTAAATVCQPHILTILTPTLTIYKMATHSVASITSPSTWAFVSTRLVYKLNPGILTVSAKIEDKFSPYALETLSKLVDFVQV